jgi:hypothetical protein
MWRGGFNPPSRFLVPIVPALALGLAWLMQGRRSAAVALLAGWGLFAGLAGGTHPSLVHRDRDGSAPFYRAESGATEWTRLLPRYVLEEPDRHRLALVWACVLLAALLRARAPLGRRSLAYGIAALAIAAEVAGRASVGRAGGREAVHRLGEPALDWPHVAFERAAVARWTSDDLSWGAVYEPHRHSGTAALAERLPLPAARYRLTLEGEALGGRGAAPSLQVLGRDNTPLGVAACRDTAVGWDCEFPVSGLTAEVSLVLQGGSTFRLHEIRLWRLVQPLEGPPV